MIIQQICCRQRESVRPDFPNCPTQPPRRKNPPGGTRISGLVFEVSGTLYDDTCWWRWMAQLISHTGLRTKFDAFYQGWEARFSDDVCRGRDEFWHALRSYLLSCGLSRGLCDEIVAAGHARHRLLDGDVQPLAGVRETLAKLKCYGATLVAVCNSPCSTRQLQTRLETMGVGGHFDLALSSLDLGCTIPSSQFFQVVLARNKLAADQTALVSNRAAHLAGASRAGMLSVAFNHRPDVEADICLGRFAELLDTVRCSEVRMLAG